MTTHLGRMSGVVVLILACAIPLGAQAPQPGSQVVESVKLEVVNVEVYVTDRDGRPVPGLSASDFELLDDGRPVELSNFYVGDGFAAAARPSLGAPEAGSPVTAERSAPSDQGQALHVVVLVDGLNIDNFSRSVAIEGVAKAIETRLRPGDDVMVANYDHSLRILCPLTTDLGKAVAALRGIRKESSEGQFIRLQSSASMDIRLQSSATLDGTGYGGFDGMGAQRTRSLEANLFSSSAQLLDSLAGVPGRKALVFVSKGIASRLGRKLFSGIETYYPGQVPDQSDRTRYDFPAWPPGSGDRLGVLEAMQFDLGHRFPGLAERANAGRVTFYPVDAELYRGLAAVSAERARPVPRPEEYNEEMEQSASLLRLAEATGGRVLNNTTDLGERFGTVIDGIDAFYSLGFVNPHSGDRKYHRLTVKARREGLELRYREGYLDKPEEARQADRAAAALLTGGRTNPLGLEADTGPAVRKWFKTLRVPLTVSLPGSSITLLPDAKGMSGKVSILVAAADSEGHQSKVYREEFVIPVPLEKLETMRQERTVFTFKLLVRAGETTLAVTARDELGQVESTITLGVTTQPPAVT